jgi:DNA-binding IclR family transcriptional regulator
VRTQGFALDDEERDMGVRCLAIPVRIVPGPLAAMSLAGPAGEFGPDTWPKYLGLLRSTGLAMEADYKVGAALSALRSSTPVLSDVTGR